MFETGVKGYVKGTFTVVVNFPIDWNGTADVRCRHCPFLSSNERLCQLTKDVVQYPNKYIGAMCPLKFEERE